MNKRCPSCEGELTAQGDCLPCLVALAATPTQASSSSLGSFASYDILEKIATGGMEMLSDRAMQSPDALRRFQTETEAAASLDHPHIVPIFETGLEEELAFYSMPYLPGGTLADLLEKGIHDQRDSIEIMQKISRAVAYAHRRGILHRDLKPTNILLDEHGEPQITDFGLAKLSGQDTAVTLSGTVLGTPAYMSPPIVLLSKPTLPWKF